MVAQNWIKALNTRLAETPSIGAKVGYATAVAIVGMFAIALTIGLSVLATLPVVLKALLQGWIGHKEIHADGWRDGSHGFGEYRDGVFQTMFHGNEED